MDDKRQKGPQIPQNKHMINKSPIQISITQALSNSGNDKGTRMSFAIISKQNKTLAGEWYLPTAQIRQKKYSQRYVHRAYFVSTYNITKA